MKGLFKKIEFGLLNRLTNHIYGTDIMLLLPKQTRQKNTGTKVNFINGKTEEQRNWSDMSKVTQELTTDFLLLFLCQSQKKHVS